MPKRSYEEKMDYYMRKMEKLKKRQRQENEPPSPHYCDPSIIQGDETPMEMWQMPEQSPAPPYTEPEGGQMFEYNEPDEQPPEAPTDPNPPPQDNISTPPPVQVPSEPTQATEGKTFPPLDPDTLSALGEATDQGPTWGQEIHNNLTQLWQPLLRQGMAKETREKILKEYLIPSNCTLLQAPKLNVEISAAVLEMVRLRDKKVEATQQQLGAGIAAVSKAMTSLLTNGDKIEAIKILSDSCRILCDLHHAQTQTRIKMITPGLHKQFLNVIQDSERDETLFGVGLPDKIKASKTIEKQGLQIKKPAPPPRHTMTTNTLTTRQQYQGNWNGPPPLSGEQGGSGRSQEVSPVIDVVTPTSASSIDFDNAAQNEPEPVTCPNASITQATTSTTSDAYTGSSAALRTAFIRRGAPPAALRLILASLSENTLQQYGVCYKSWWQYCHDNNYDVFDNTVSHVVTFLTNQFEKGSSYGTLNSHRSALSLLLGNNIALDDCVKRLLKGAYKLRPSLPRYQSTWDPQLVLNYISNWVPNQQIGVEKLVKKLVMLLALCTAHRVQTFSLIKLNNIKISTNGIEILITDIIKTSGIGRDQPVLYLPYFRENISICPATALVDYMNITKDIRPLGMDHLLLTVKRPYKNATAQTISRWIKQTLGASGIDISEYSAHSARHAATSAASVAGVNIDVIRKTAGWSSSSQTFAKFYNRPILEE